MINHDTDAWIKRNVKIKDTIGINREFDVAVESQSKGVSLFSVFECKDFSTPTGTLPSKKPKPPRFGLTSKVS